MDGSSYNCTTTGNQVITSSAGDVALTGTDVTVTTTGTGAGEFVVRANTNVDIKANTGNLELNANTTMLITSGGTQTTFVDTENKMVITSTTTTLTNTSVTVAETSSFNMMPTATIIQNMSATVPAGFLYCNGGNISRTTYARLFAAIGTAFGIGDGSTTFGKPNLMGAFLRGASTQTVGGVAYTAAAVGTAQQDAVLTPLYASNEGYFNTTSGGATRECVSRNRITADPTDTNTGILPRFDREATENRPFNFAVYYYIRY